MRIVAAIAVVLFLTVSLHSQASPAEQHNQQAATNLLPDAPSTAQTIPAASPVVDLRAATFAYRTGSPHRKIVDRKFLLVAGLATAATVADVELTMRCLRNWSCTEANPLYGSRPTRARAYGISLPLLAGNLALSYWSKKQRPSGKMWLIPSLAVTAVHSVGAAMAAGQ